MPSSTSSWIGGSGKWWNLKTGQLAPLTTSSTFAVLERKTKYVRYIEVKNYYTEVETKKKWIKEQLDLFDEIRLADLRKPIDIPYQFQLFEDAG